MLLIKFFSVYSWQQSCLWQLSTRLCNSELEDKKMQLGDLKVFNKLKNLWILPCWNNQQPWNQSCSTEHKTKETQEFSLSTQISELFNYMITPFFPQRKFWGCELLFGVFSVGVRSKVWVFFFICPPFSSSKDETCKRLVWISIMWICGFLQDHWLIYWKKWYNAWEMVLRKSCKVWWFKSLKAAVKRWILNLPLTEIHCNGLWFNS